MTEGPTLLPPFGSDKRTKEVFVLSPERINAALARLCAGACAPWMAGYQAGGWRQGVTVVISVTVLVLKRYYSFCYNPLFLPGFQGKRPAPTFGRTAEIRRIGYCIQSVTGVH
ncbi:hypothetical protein DENIT_20247 [Pseudomonas veronii]|nr:hypothetical protein DENIT_20247 [Pseudomonas veronii]